MPRPKPAGRRKRTTERRKHNETLRTEKTAERVYESLLRNKGIPGMASFRPEASDKSDNKRRYVAKMQLGRRKGVPRKIRTGDGKTITLFEIDRRNGASDRRDSQRRKGEDRRKNK